jgi:proline-specific peptidase
VLVTGATVVAVTVALALTVFRPLDDPNHPPTPVPELRFWDLPTGSHLAYVKIPATGDPKPAPVIHLHGGPGVSEMPVAVQFFGRLAQDGFDVYVYDQIGVGRSDRLDDPTQYTVARHVADLDAVRERIGAEQVILIGHSWGARLAATYLTEHAEHVAKVVFSSPGTLCRSRDA